jgi:hypothetical protein
MKVRSLTVAATVALVAVPAAVAAIPAEKGYGGGGQIQGELGQGALNAGGNLPFTGLDLALLVIGGLMLLLVGITLRHGSRGGQRVDRPSEL